MLYRKSQNFAKLCTSSTVTLVKFLAKKMVQHNNGKNTSPPIYTKKIGEDITYFMLKRCVRILQQYVFQESKPKIFQVRCPK